MVVCQNGVSGVNVNVTRLGPEPELVQTPRQRLVASLAVGIKRKTNFVIATALVSTKVFH